MLVSGKVIVGKFDKHMYKYNTYIPGDSIRDFFYPLIVGDLTFERVTDYHLKKVTKNCQVYIYIYIYIQTIVYKYFV